MAIEYAQRHREDYSAIVWIDATDETAINQSFARLAIWILNYDPSANYISVAVQSKDQNKIVEAVKNWFDEPANSSWLIIYDNYWRIDSSIFGSKNEETSLVLKENVSHPDSISSRTGVTTGAFDIRTYLPETDHGAVVVISTESLGNLWNCIEVRPFEHLTNSLDLLSSASCRENIREGKLSQPIKEKTRLKQF